MAESSNGGGRREGGGDDRSRRGGEEVARHFRTGERGGRTGVARQLRTSKSNRTKLVLERKKLPAQHQARSAAGRIRCHGRRPDRLQRIVPVENSHNIGKLEAEDQRRIYHQTNTAPAFENNAEDYNRGPKLSQRYLAYTSERIVFLP
jgi:hypothetical protein